MKLIKQSFEIVEQPSGLEGMYKQIELIGRVCTKSEDKITEGSAEKFIDNLIELNHGSPLEHGTVYLYIDYHNPSFGKVIDRYINNKYSKCNIFPNFPNKAYISSNYRVLVENNWLDDLKYLCEPTELYEKRVCVKFILPIGISREFCRHRVFSFMEMSTRYCNFSKDKFDNELTFIQPSWVKYKGEITPDTELCFLSGQYNREDPTLRYLASLVDSKYSYLTLLAKECKPQEARDVLPLATKTELYMTGFISDWKSFFELRSNKYGRGGAHPQADELATSLYEEFKKRGYI